MRDQLQLNPHLFDGDEEVLAHLREVLPDWRDLGISGEPLASWEPDTRIENAEHENFLILKSDREFRLHRVTVMGPTGAVVYVLPESPEWEQLRSQGYRILIPAAALTEVWNNSGGPREGRAAASIGYELSAGDQRRKFSLRIMLTQDFYGVGSASYGWIKATG